MRGMSLYKFPIIDLEVQMQLHILPFAMDDAVNTGVPQCFLRQGMSVDLMLSQHAIQLGPQALNGAAALVVEHMCAKFHCNAFEFFKRMAQQQTLGFGVQGGALHTVAVPRRANFQAAVGAVDVHVSGHARDLLALGVDDRKGQHEALRLKPESPLNFSGHLVWVRHQGVPKPPKFAVFHRCLQAVQVRGGQWLQAHMLASQFDGLDSYHYSMSGHFYHH